MRILHVVGARPNFMKIAPIMLEMSKYLDESEQLLVHTGQHYDYEMSKIFFEDLDIPEPDIHLEIGSGSHADQTGKVMIGFERVLFQEGPDLVVVVGDVNSTLACALASVKLNLPVAHVEAGLRSFDRTMPEEINRLLTDAVSDYLFTPSPDADENLKREGISEDKIFLVGNVMVDSLLSNLEKAKKSNILKKLGLEKGLAIDYALLTLHRPSNVDNKDAFLCTINALTEISKHIPIIFPIHPRTRKQIETFRLQKYFSFLELNSIDSVNLTDSVNLIAPVGYLEFLRLQMNAKFVMTDSGGIQEETTVLDIPCLTLRNTTERPITISRGTNTLVSNHTEKIVKEAFKILDGQGKKGNCPDMWDGKAARRIVDVLMRRMEEGG